MWTLHIQLILSHLSVPIIETSDQLATSAHIHDSPMIRVHRFVEERSLFSHFLRSCHPDNRVSSGNSSTPVHHSGISRANVSLLHRLRTGSAFTGSTLTCIDAQQGDKCPTCAVLDDVDHVLLKCSTHDTEWNSLFTALRASDFLESTVYDLLFSQGSAQS